MSKRTSDQTNPPPVSSSRLTSQPTSNASSPGSLGSGRIFAPPLPEPHSALPGYLGSTSFTAVLTEHRNEIPFEPEDHPDPCPVLTVAPDRVQSGAEVLLFLYSFKHRQKLLNQFHLRTCNAIAPEVLVRATLASIERTFDEFDGHNLMPRLQKLATQIFRNTSRPMTSHPSMSVKEYCDSFTGENLRWEPIGNLFSIFGQQLVAKDHLLEQVVVATTICINYCDEASSANEILAYLQYNDIMLRTQQYGDSNYQAWRRVGDLVATVYAVGLHTDGEEHTRPFFLRQWRKGCFISVFYLDKMQASFFGRPPLINYRYCTMVPPLDLSDDVIIEGGDALNKAISELDGNGWNTHGARYRITPSLLRFKMAICREQTLELALGTDQPQDLVQKTQEIKEKICDVWESTPDQIRYDRRKNDDFHDAFLTIVYMYLNYLYTCFLLQRTLIKYTNTGQEELCDISRQTLAIVINLTSARHPMVDLDRHYSWIALSYGLPAASVLLLELLHQSHNPGPHNVELPRSELIRNLSVFISVLSWVSRPGHGNHQACKEAEKKLSRILDQLLDPQPVPAEMVHDVTSGLSSFLDWSNSNAWDFNTEYFSATDAFVQ
ncbi:hypothetical protein N7533_007356 [Penicillium manginii]|uniref:uncharacterized protein n=1 Tax=Penicillium manginii TaxID=203109 RepID=UPI0025472430|nr:uncharacterized protein N7533_007356 [Penicillium manginii]KAJ5750328.1 hypothetical protein N7533_007356 [Penicillium manginii]